MNELLKKFLFFLTLILCIPTVFAMKNNNRMCKRDTCLKCSKKFKSHFGLKNHEKKCTGKKYTINYQYIPSICPFSGCVEIFKDVNDLLNHMREKHADKKTKKCNFPNCTKNPDTWAHLKEHMYHHLAEKYFCCPVCSKKFKWLKHLKKHLKEHPPEQNIPSTTPLFIQPDSNFQQNVAADNNNDAVLHLSETLLQEDQNDQEDLEIPEDLENLKCLKDAELELFLEQCNASKNSDS